MPVFELFLNIHVGTMRSEPALVHHRWTARQVLRPPLGADLATVTYPVAVAFLRSLPYPPPMSAMTSLDVPRCFLPPMSERYAPVCLCMAIGANE